MNDVPTYTRAELLAMPKEELVDCLLISIAAQNQMLDNMQVLALLLQQKAETPAAEVTATQGEDDEPEGHVDP